MYNLGKYDGECRGIVWMPHLLYACDKVEAFVSKYDSASIQLSQANAMRIRGGERSINEIDFN